MWAVLLTDWKKRFGFERIVYVDIANETPYFFPWFSGALQEGDRRRLGAISPHSPPHRAHFLPGEINKSLGIVYAASFPSFALPHPFMATCDGSMCRWSWIVSTSTSMPTQIRAGASARASASFSGDHLFETDSWFAEFSKHATETSAAIAPMLRARQRFKMVGVCCLGRAARVRRSQPLKTWSSWFYIDNAKLDWGWLLDGPSGLSTTPSTSSSGAGLRTTMLSRSLQLEGRSGGTEP